MIVIGIGGFAKEVYETLFDLNLIHQIERFTESIRDQFRVSFFCKKFVKLLFYLDLNGKKLVLSFGDHSSRAAFVGDCDSIVLLQNIIHLSTIITSFTKFGIDAIIGSGASKNAVTILEDDTVIDGLVAIGHVSTIGEYSQLCPECVINRNSKLGNGVFISAKSVIRERIKISDNIVVGMGAIVVRDIEIEGIYVVNPTKLKQ